MRGIYAIVDLDALSRAAVDPEAFVERVLATRPCALQLRAKSAEGRVFLETARAIGAAARRADVPFFVNDRADIAILANARGLHVGQADLDPSEVAALCKRAGCALDIGLSTHNEAQLRAALDQPIDYVAIGPIFSTESKARPDATLGVDAARSLASIARRARPDLPIVAIGGLSLDSVGQLRGVVDAVAVISALVPVRGETIGVVDSRAAALRDAFVGAAA